MLIQIHLFSSTGVMVVAQVNLRWSVLISIKLSQIGSFHELVVLATECFFNFDNFEIQSDVFFLVCSCVVVLLKVHGSTKFLILEFLFLKYVVFFYSSLMRFLLYNCFHFSGNCVAS